MVARVADLVGFSSGGGAGDERGSGGVAERVEENNGRESCVAVSLLKKKINKIRLGRDGPGRAGYRKEYRPPFAWQRNFEFFFLGRN